MFSSHLEYLIAMKRVSKLIDMDPPLGLCHDEELLELVDKIEIYERLFIEEIVAANKGQ